MTLSQRIIEIFENYLEERTGKHVRVEYKYLDKPDVQADNILDYSDKVAMDIEIEEELSDTD